MFHYLLNMLNVSHAYTWRGGFVYGSNPPYPSTAWSFALQNPSIAGVLRSKTPRLKTHRVFKQRSWPFVICPSYSHLLGLRHVTDVHQPVRRAR